MSILFDFYLQLRVRTRIILLCFCYSTCIVAAVGAGRYLPLYQSVLSTAVFVLLGIIFSSLLFRSVNNALQRIISHLNIMISGDLSTSIGARHNNEISTIIRSISTLQTTMRDILAKISQSSDQVALASGSLHANAQQIAAGTEGVVSQAGTAALASEEMAATSSDIAGNCMRAAENSRRASGTARSGEEVVRQTTDGMERIAQRVREAARTVADLGARSDQIGEIIGTIEEIADQTNLLALNAAIEAARAGEQGRGFAVVADEVRALAERTTRATREIGAMIKAIQNETRGAVSAIEIGGSEVATGTENSQRSGQALEQILEQVSEVTMQIDQIATAAEQQSATTAEISGTIQKITDAFHQNARGIAETADAAATLSRESEELRCLVGQFRL